MKNWLALPIALLLVGCSGPPAHGFAPTCIGDICSADLDAPASKRAQAVYGLTRLTNDPIEAARLSVSDGWVSWRALQGPGLLFAMNLETRELIHIGTGAAPWTNKGRTVFDGPQETTMWEVESRIATKLDLGARLQGRTGPLQLDGDWLLISVGTDPQNVDTGTRAINLQDGRQVFLVDPIAKNEGGFYETFTSFTIADAKGYYVIARANENMKYYNSTIYRIDLETGAKTEFFLDDFSIAAMHAGKHHLAFSSGGKLWSLDPNGGIPQRISLDGEAHCGAPRTAEHWIVYACDGVTTAVNMETGRRVHYGAGGADQNFYTSEPTTDGQVVVLRGIPNDASDGQVHEDLFYAELPIG